MMKFSYKAFLVDDSECLTIGETNSFIGIEGVIVEVGWECMV
jgi:hypothetical protein